MSTTAFHQIVKSCPSRVTSFTLILVFLFYGATASVASTCDFVSADEHSSLPKDFGGPFIVADQKDQPTTDTSAEKKREVPSIAAYGKAFLPDLVDGTKRIFSPDIAPVALVGLGLTGLAFTLDHTVQDYFQQHQPISNVSHYGDSWGQGYVQFGLGAALFSTGYIIDNKQLADTGAVSIEALAVTGIATESLKYLTHRERPNHQDNMSFPSGHASMTAAFAASVSEMYDWNLYLAVPLFAASAFVGASRIQDNMHHFSDVMAGWTLGTVVGMSFGRSRKEKNSSAEGESSLSAAPFADGTSRGIVFNWRF